MSLYAMERVLRIVSHPQGAGSRAWNGSPIASGANLLPSAPVLSPPPSNVGLLASRLPEISFCGF